MATHTTYYNLTKPAQNDKVNIGVLNDNADIIDTALHNKVDSDDLTANNVMMSDGVTTVADVLPKVTDWYTVPRDITVSAVGYAVIGNFTTVWGLPADFDGERIIGVQAINIIGTQKPITFDVVISNHRIDGILGQAGTIYAGLKIRLIYI